MRGLVASIALVSMPAACGFSAARVDDAPPVPSDVAPVDVVDALVALDAPVDASGDAALDGPPLLPDLRFHPPDMTRTLVTTTDIPPEDCAVEESCVTGTGLRQLLRFKTVTMNAGAAHLVIGRPPPDGQSNDVFTWSDCHKHHHVRNYTHYELLDDNGSVVMGRKQAFCLADTKPVTPGLPSAGFLCSNQGISRGWADVYDLDLPCQWIDVTGVPPGRYKLRITVNPDHQLPDSDLTNNVFTQDVQL